MVFDRREQPVHTGGVVVVEQEPHADTAVGRATHGVQQQAAREVVVPDVVLQVDAADGGIDERDARPARSFRAASASGDVDSTTGADTVRSSSDGKAMQPERLMAAANGSIRRASVAAAVFKR